MEGRRSGLSRRKVLASGGWLALGALLGRAEKALATGETKSRVVLVREPSAFGKDGAVNPGVVQEMLDVAVAALLGVKDAREAWSQLVAPTDIVGLKSNVWRYLPTPPAVEEAIRTRVLGAGVKADAIAIDDRGVRDNPVFQRATALVNVRPMRTHFWAGLGTCVKNYIMFVPEPSTYHDNACERLGAVWHLPHVKGRTRLNVLVMLTPLFHGIGPHHFNREYTWPYAGLLVSRDPAPADAVGARIITARRREYFGEERPITPPPHHITLADTRYQLGAARLEEIELLRLGEQKGNLLEI